MAAISSRKSSLAAHFVRCKGEGRRHGALQSVKSLTAFAVKGEG
jgi:hypothetical protein